MSPSIQETEPRLDTARAADPVTAWPGFDPGFGEALRLPSLLAETEAFTRRIEGDLSRARGWSCGMGPPALVQPAQSARVHQVAEAFHRALEVVVRAYEKDPHVRRTLSMSGRLAADADRDQRPTNARIHLCRLDLMLSADGGFHVLEAPDGREALRLSEEYPGDIDVLVSDVSMPEMGGVELGRAILEERPTVRVLLVTGHAHDDVSLPGARLLCKPFRQEELAWALEALLSGKVDRA